MKIKVMADYDCSPLWWDGDDPALLGNLQPEDLNISSTLRADLWAWAAEYNATLVRDDPVRSVFSTHDDEQAFDERGRLLTKRIAAELGSRADVRFWRDLQRQP